MLLLFSRMGKWTCRLRGSFLLSFALLSPNDGAAKADGVAVVVAAGDDDRKWVPAWCWCC